MCLINFLKILIYVNTSRKTFYKFYYQRITWQLKSIRAEFIFNSNLIIDLCSIIFFPILYSFTSARYTVIVRVKLLMTLINLSISIFD